MHGVAFILLSRCKKQRVKQCRGQACNRPTARGAGPSNLHALAVLRSHRQRSGNRSRPATRWQDGVSGRPVGGPVDGARVRGVARPAVDGAGDGASRGGEHAAGAQRHHPHAQHLRRPARVLPAQGVDARARPPRRVVPALHTPGKRRRPDMRRRLRQPSMTHFCSYYHAIQPDSRASSHGHCVLPLVLALCVIRRVRVAPARDGQEDGGEKTSAADFGNMQRERHQAVDWQDDGVLLPCQLHRPPRHCPHEEGTYVYSHGRPINPSTTYYITSGLTFRR
jgi:hypothetical protein